MATVEDLFGEEVDQQRTRPLALVEEWIDGQSQSWEDGYNFLRARGVRYRYAMLATWLSVGRYDRGELKTREDFADFMGVAKSTTYQWEDRKPIREWAELLRLIRLRGHRLAEVDERSYLAAVDEGSSAADRKLYYQRARVWDEGSSSVNVHVDDEEIDREIERELARLAAGGEGGDVAAAAADTDA